MREVILVSCNLIIAESLIPFIHTRSTMYYIRPLLLEITVNFLNFRTHQIVVITLKVEQDGFTLK